jgi:soluble lytic murein transglycosylase-like protein
MTSTTRRALPALLLTAVVLAVAFAGGATAAKLITGKQIKNNTVSTQDIKNNNVKSKDVKNGALAEADLNGAVKGKLNAPSVKGYEVKSTTVEVGTAGQETVFVACSPGKLAISGGASWETTEFDAVIQESSPSKAIGDLFAPADPTYADAWRVTGQHNGLNPADLTAYVICVNPS